VISLPKIIPQTGERNFHSVKSEAQVVVAQDRMHRYHPLGFFHETELRHAYAACDFVVTRAGANFIFEIAALGKPSIIIPLPESAQDHQIKNAYAYAQSGAAVVLEAANLTPNFFLERLRYFFAHPAEMEHMRKSALSFAKPEAAKVLSERLLAFMQ